MLVALALPCGAAQAAPAVMVIDRVQRLASNERAPPGAERAWAPASLPDGGAANRGRPQQDSVWYRMVFNGPPADAPPTSWAVYLPFFYDGGSFWLNGLQVASVPESSATVQVRWERPHLINLPAGLLHSGDNVLAIRAAALPAGNVRRMPRVSIGPLDALQPTYDRRMFWARTLPQITTAVCLLMAGFVLFIWWRRRSEMLYGLFGITAALWGIRTLTFVIEQMPVAQWHLWRMAYLGATGGFVVLMAIFALRFAGIRRPWIERGLLLYALVGPLWLGLQGRAAEPFINRFWSAGLIPVGLSVLGVSLYNLLRQRTWAAALLPAALVFPVVAGVHDYLLAWDVAPLMAALPHWTEQRIFLLHHGANLLLLVMGGLLTVRFVRALSALEQLNFTLEARVADRERHLAANFSRMATLQQQHAAAQERQLIMREIHDGLGSRLFTSLSRVERGDMDEAQIAEALRDCIGDMRLALDALTPGEEDFRVVLGNFLFRWQEQLEDAGVRSAWTIDWPEGAPPLAPQRLLQLLRIMQEAFTNVLKHAQATQLHMALRPWAGGVEVEVQDDGRSAVTPQRHGGRGLANMRARATQLGGELIFERSDRGTRVLARVPVVAPSSTGLALQTIA